MLTPENVMRVSKLATTAAVVFAWTLFVALSDAQTPAPRSDTDPALATEIERRLSADPEVNAQTIKIDVRGGVATLTGRVNADDVKQRAATLAAGVPGVVDVRNEILVSGGGVRGDHGPGPIPEQMPGVD